MAVRANNAVRGETRLGNRGRSLPSILHVQSGRPQQGAILALDAVAANGTRTTIYLWASSDGKIRTGTAIPANTETGGTVIGTQV
jgi:hypothetical protein